MFKADLHIHSVLSPCAALEMSPKNIVKRAVEEKLDIIAITDHNHTKNIEVTQNIAKRYNIEVIPGVEVNSKEEVHILAYFQDIKKTELFQEFIDLNRSEILNTDHRFGYQLVVDEDDNILEDIKYLLTAALSSSIEEITEKVAELDGICIPAHVNKYAYSIISQLGFIPKNLKIQAIEQIRPFNNEILKLYYGFSTIVTSDAHHPEQIGSNYSLFCIEKPDFNELKLALLNQQGREVKV